MTSIKDLIDVLEELDYPESNKINFDNLSLENFSYVANWISKQFNFFAKTETIVNIITGIFFVLFFYFNDLISILFPR